MTATVQRLYSVVLPDMLSSETERYLWHEAWLTIMRYFMSALSIDSSRHNQAILAEARLLLLGRCHLYVQGMEDTGAFSQGPPKPVVRENTYITEPAGYGEVISLLWKHGAA